MPSERAEIIRQLRQRLTAVPARGTASPSAGCGAWEELLPGGGFRRGTLVEWLSDGDGSGAETLAVTSAARLIDSGGVCVVVDRERSFYHPAAAALGLCLERTIVLRPSSVADALWAAEQCLRSPGVTVVLGRLEKASDRALRRLQLAAESGGVVGFLLRPSGARTRPSWADARLLVEPVPSSMPSGRRLRVELLRCRMGTSGGAVIVDVDHEAGSVRSIPELAPPAAARRAARA